VDWTQDRADELCPGQKHHSYGVRVCSKYDNPDYQRRLEFALANKLFSTCRHACLYDYDSFNTSRPHAFRWVGDCYNVATGFFCIDQQLAAMKLSHAVAEELCTGDAEDCVERVAWTQDVAEGLCPNGYSGGDKGWGTAILCPVLLRREDGFYDRVDELYEASFNLSLANHMFRSCEAKCIYDIVNEGVVYQYLGGCWKMQTRWACIEVHTAEYQWAMTYLEERVCPIEQVETPAPTPFVCVERQQQWNEEIAQATCSDDFMVPTIKGADAITCDGYEDYQFRLNTSLANRMFLSCDAWCVYDIYTRAEQAFIWSNSGQCYKPVQSGLCIWQQSSNREKMMDYVENILCESSTGEPTGAPTCIEQREWSEDVINDLCSVDETRLTYKHYSSIGRAAVPCAGYEDYEGSLLKSLAMKMFDQCSSWCVYDYYSNARLAWQWNNGGLCWNLKSSGRCYTDSSEGGNNTEWEAAKESIKYMCSHPPTLSPTGCVPFYNWTEERAEELCPSTSDYGEADKSYGVKVCDDNNSLTKQANLEKSLANRMSDTCSSWCVYDYDTVLDNYQTDSYNFGGFIWKTDCWKWVTGFACFTSHSEEFERVSSRAGEYCDDHLQRSTKL